MPLLTIFADVFIALSTRVLIYIFAMLVGAGSTAVGLKVAEKTKANREAARKTVREQRDAARFQR